jgi:uncharacterized protein
MKLNEALRILSTHKDEISKFGVGSLAIFGSVARNEARTDSDIDILVEFDKPVGLFEFIDLKDYLEKVLQSHVDMGTPSSLKPKLREQVPKEAIYVPLYIST